MVSGRDPNEARPVTQAREEDAIGEGAAGAPGRGRRVLGVSHPRGTEAGRSGTGINYVHVVAGSQLMGGLAGPGGIRIGLVLIVTISRETSRKGACAPVCLKGPLWPPWGEKSLQSRGKK